MPKKSAVNTKYVIALYLRISQEDGTKNESNSIKTQREMIRHYVSSRDEFRDAAMVDYVDDGISGSHTQREAYRQLMSDVERGDVDCIIVKDLSRIGSSSLDVDELLMNHLVVMNVRFIAINNGYDSLLHPLSNLELAFINLANQHYNRDLAQKSITAKLVKQKRGEYLAHAPFGYKKSDNEKNKLVPDEEAAGYVRLIYSLAVEGRRTVEIAQILNAQGIPSPSSYKVRNGWNNMWTQVIDPDYRFWTNGVVRKLIMNEVYIGKAVSNKFKVTEPGKNHTAPRPKDEWIVVSGAHEPLVSESDFQKAQLILPKKKYHCKPEHIFGNKVKCPDCGHAMIRYTQQNLRFKCGTAKFTSHYGCKSHNILQSDIEKVVLAAVRAYAASQIDREELNLAVMERNSILVRELESRILEEEKAIKVIESSITKLYISLAEEEISKDAYIHKKSIINETLSRKRDALDRMRELHKTMRDKIAVADSAVTELTPLVSIESLDSEVVSLLIDRILVYGENDIEIVWNDKF